MSFQRVTLKASAQESASANGSLQSIPRGSMGAVTLDITAIIGTLNVWLEASNDDGTDWFEVPYDQQLTLTAAAADQAANTHRKNINGTASATATGKHLAVYKHLPYKSVRLAWTLTGGTATFESTLELK